MQVVHLVPARFGADGVVGGAERYTWELARHMARVVPTTLVTFGTTDRDETVDGLRVRVIGRPVHVRGQWSNPFSLQVFGALREADVVHCHQQHILISSVVAAWCRLTGRKVFVTDLGGGGWDVSAYLSTDAWFDGHLHISEFSRTAAGHADETRASVVTGGVDPETFTPDPAIVRSWQALFVGRLLPHKGLDDLVDGLPEGIGLRVVGPAPDAAFAERLRRRAEGKPVEFMTTLSDAELVREYRRALCVVLPSVHRPSSGGPPTPVPELLGQTLLEGMACEAPVVCTAVASLPEIVEHGVTGLVVPPNDPPALGRALTMLRDDPARARAMGRAARVQVSERFAWRTAVARCLDAYTATPRRALSWPLVLRRAVSALVLTLLVLAGARSAVVVGRHHVGRLQEAGLSGRPLVSRAHASSDWALGLAGLASSSAAVVAAVEEAGVPPHAALVFLRGGEGESPRFQTAYYTASYLLYPRRVWTEPTGADVPFPTGRGSAAEAQYALTLDGSAPAERSGARIELVPGLFLVESQSEPRLAERRR